MAYTPPTVAQLRAEVVSRCGRILVDAGLLRIEPDGSIPLIDYGLARGAMDTGMLLSDARTATDAEIAALSPFAIERVVIWAEHHCLKLIVQRWYDVVRTHNQKAQSTDAHYSGWLLEQKEGVKGRRDELRAILDEPFRDTTDPVSVANRWGYPPGLHGPAGPPGWYPDTLPCYDPAIFPYGYGYRDWGCFR